MRDEGFDERDFMPFFGCQPHTPDRVFEPPAGGDRAARRKVCPTCEGKTPPEGSKLVCAGCHGVAPEYQARFDAARVEAISSREPERAVMARAIADTTGNRFVLTEAERTALVEELGPLASTWLESVGQPAPAKPAAGTGETKQSRRKARDAKAARARLAKALAVAGA